MVKALEDFQLFSDVQLPTTGEAGADVNRAVLQIMQSANLSHPLCDTPVTSQAPDSYCWVPLSTGKRQIRTKKYTSLTCHSLNVGTADHAQFTKPFNKASKLFSPDEERPLILIGDISPLRTCQKGLTAVIGFKQCNPRAPLTTLQALMAENGIALPPSHAQRHECFGPLLLSCIEKAGTEAFSTLDRDCSEFRHCPEPIEMEVECESSLLTFLYQSKSVEHSSELA
jgi:hypothetical protein